MTRSNRFLSTITNTSSSFDQTTAEPPEAVAVESDFVVILAALLCALICVLGLIAVARCKWLRRGSTSSTRANPSSATANKGIKKKVVETLPKFVYNNKKEYGHESWKKNIAQPDTVGIDCAICISEYVDGDEIRVLPQCGHGFHVSCIDMWLSSHSSCPTCRQVLGVTRCKKCGEFPAEVSPETQPKSGEEHGNSSCSNDDYLP